MLSARSVLLILLLLAGCLSPPLLRAQEATRDPPAGRTQPFYFEQNYPNPVDPQTWIPFTLEDELFENRDTVRITIRIFNVLRQVVAIPVAADRRAPIRPNIIDLPYTEPGRKIAFWNGDDQAGRRVASGVYYAQLVIDGFARPSILKMIVLNPRSRRIRQPNS